MTDLNTTRQPQPLDVIDTAARTARYRVFALILGAFFGVQSIAVPAAANKAKPPCPPPMPAGKTNSTSEGGRLFADFCAACHGAQGAGIPEVFPALVQNDVVNAKDPTAHVVVILNGIHGRPIGGKPYVTQMPSFSWLNDEEIAAIINFERSSWGNHLPILSAHTVAAVRQAIEHVDQVDSIKRLEF